VEHNGNLRATLFRAGYFTPHYMQRLVALAFVPNPGNKLCTDHADGNGNTTTREYV
jgi:hypothetical protein